MKTQKTFILSLAVFSILSLTSFSVFSAGQRQTNTVRSPLGSSSAATVEMVTLPSRCGKNYEEAKLKQVASSVFNQYKDRSDLEVWYCRVRDDVYNEKPNNPFPCPGNFTDFQSYVAPLRTASALFYDCEYFSSSNYPETESCMNGFHIIDAQRPYFFTCARDNSKWDPENRHKDLDACNPPDTWMGAFISGLVLQTAPPYYGPTGLQVCAKSIESNAPIYSIPSDGGSAPLPR